MPMADVLLLVRLQTSLWTPGAQGFEGPGAQVLTTPTQALVSRQALVGCSIWHG